MYLTGISYFSYSKESNFFRVLRMSKLPTSHRLSLLLLCILGITLVTSGLPQPRLHLRGYLLNLIMGKKNMFQKSFSLLDFLWLLWYNLDCVLFTHCELSVCVASLAWRERGLPNGRPRAAGWWRGTWWWPTTLPSGRRVNSWRPWRGRSGSTLTCRNCWWSIPLDAGKTPRRREETA